MEKKESDDYYLSMFEKTFVNFLNENRKGKSENFRSEYGIDIQSSDRLKKKIKDIPKLFLNFKTKTYKINKTDLPKNRTEVLSLINTNPEGLFIQNLLKSYTGIKLDLFEIVEFTGKNRLVILLKGNPITKTLVFPFEESMWIIVSQKLIEFWHISDK